MTKERLEQIIWTNPITLEIATELIMEFCEKHIHRIPNSQELQILLRLGQYINWNWLMCQVAELNGYQLITITKDNLVVARYLQ